MKFCFIIYVCIFSLIVQMFGCLSNKIFENDESAISLRSKKKK